MAGEDEEDEFAGLPEDEPLLEDNGNDEDEDDDDDDDDDENERAEGEGADFLPVMKGNCSLVEGRLFWSGLWADSEEAFVEGSTKKFKYGGPDNLTEKALDEPPVRLISKKEMVPTLHGPGSVSRCTFAGHGLVEWILYDARGRRGRRSQGARKRRDPPL